MASLPKGAPLLQVIVDTEEEFDWELPFDRRNVSVTSIAAQRLAQELYVPYGLQPTYMVDFPVAQDRHAAEILRSFQDTGRCLIGAHLHPWVNPPFEEEVSDVNSYPGNLPVALEAAKLRMLTDTIEAALGRRPTMYKAGRHGVGDATGSLLKDLGYRIDLSVVPHTDLRGRCGPDFRRCPDRPYWVADTLLEIPLSRSFCGLAASIGTHVQRVIDSDWGRGLHIGGLLSKVRLLERATLTPEGITFPEMKRLVETMLRRGHRLFTLTYHSPSLAPGHTPYVRTARDAAVFRDRIRQVLALFFEELGARPTTPDEVLAMVRQSQAMS